MITLAIEAATYTGSVAVIRDGNVLASGNVAMRGEFEERLMPAVAVALESCGVAVARLDRVVCGAGPGSFTSLRIAASIAKGIAMSASIPLHEVSSLALLAASVNVKGGVIMPTLDAMRGQWYVALFRRDGDGTVVETRPSAVASPEDARLLAEAHGATIVGGLAGDSFLPQAAALVSIEQLVGPSVDIRSWEPSYGRLAEAQVKWEAQHGRPLSA